MTHAQILTLALSIVILASSTVAALIHSNRCICEFEQTLRAKMALGVERVSLRLRSISAEPRP
jgi:hypothetical protein